MSSLVTALSLQCACVIWEYIADIHGLRDFLKLLYGDVAFIEVNMGGAGINNLMYFQYGMVTYTHPDCLILPQSFQIQRQGMFTAHQTYSR
jgi:hypothetical protein